MVKANIIDNLMGIKHKFDQTILREYDIRGIVNKSLTELDTYMLGYFFGIIVKKKTKNKFPKIVISRDGRLSSHKLSKKLIEGLLLAGVNIIDIGLNSTPVLYFGNEYLNADGAIQITGSHNPKNYNGFKMIVSNQSFFGQDILKLGQLAEKGSNEYNSGKYNKIDIEDVYISRVLKPIHNSVSQIHSTKKIVWDCGNGATGNILNKIIKKIPGKHSIIFSEIDGNFPNHAPDPTKIENLIELKNKIKSLDADYGIAFDGDGDRMVVLQKNGELLSGDLLTAFLSLSINDKSKRIIMDVKSSLMAKSAIEKMGFEVEIWKTGHSNIKTRMKVTKSLLAGEMSGHIFFADDYYGYDDALYASIRFLVLVNQNNDLRNFLETLDSSYATPEIKVKCEEKVKFKIIQNIISRLKKKYSLKQMLLIDGVRINLEIGWYLIRASNTENAIIVRVEGKTKKDKNLLIKEVNELMEKENIFLNL